MTPAMTPTQSPLASAKPMPAARNRSRPQRVPYSALLAGCSRRTRQTHDECTMSGLEHYGCMPNDPLSLCVGGMSVHIDPALLAEIEAASAAFRPA